MSDSAAGGQPGQMEADMLAAAESLVEEEIQPATTIEPGMMDPAATDVPLPGSTLRFEEADEVHELRLKPEKHPVKEIPLIPKGQDTLAHDRISEMATALDRLDMDSVFRMNADRSQVGDLHDQATVDEMKIQTMYKMVEDVQISVQGKDVVKKVLYLTNKQANLFDADAVSRCIQALDLGEPKLVIKIMPSVGVQAQMMLAHQERVGTAAAEFGDLGMCTSEIDVSDERVAETQAVLFMRTCILPLAIQTHAVIIISGANDCFLAAALAQVALGEQARYGKDCPFRVIATLYEFEVHYKAVTAMHSTSLSAQIARGSRQWAQRMSTVHAAMERKLTSVGKKMQMCDLTSAASHYIIFESLDESSGNLNSIPAKTFQAVLLQCLTDRVPSITVHSFGLDGESVVSDLADLAARNIPVLLIDSRERAFSIRGVPARAPLTRLARESDAFPMVSLDVLKAIRYHEGVLTLQSRMELLNIAKEMMERHWKVCADKSKVDTLSGSWLAFMHSVLHCGSELDNRATAGGPGKESVPLHEIILELERLERSNKDSKKAIVPVELASSAISFLHTRHLALRDIASLAQVDGWLNSHDKDVDHLLDEANVRREQLAEKCAKNEADGGLVLDHGHATKMFLPYFDLLTSSNVYSGSLHDIDGLKRILGSVAKIDRLPVANSLEALRTLKDAWDHVRPPFTEAFYAHFFHSLEALRTLKDAWDHVEMYQQVAMWYKWVAKTMYVLLLLLGIGITVLSVIESELGFDSQNYIIAASFLGTAIGAYVSYVNPATRWQQLRVAANSLESNIWLFRTRAGLYRSSTATGGDHVADKTLTESIREIKSSVLEGADIKGTKFFSMTKKWRGHGQRPVRQPQSRTHPDRGLVRSVGSDGGDTAAEDGLVHGSNVEMTATMRDKKMSKSMTALLRGSEPQGVQLDKLIARLRQDSSEDEGPVNDSHYAPVQPDSYVRFRVHRAIAFYKSRIPRCHYVRMASQTLLVIGSIGSGALAFFGYSPWAALVSIVSSGITGYLEFQGTNSKISRYSSTVHALQELVLWWRTLPPIDRSVVANIDRLVITCEELLQREQQAWRSTSQSVKMLQKQAAEASSRRQDKKGS